ncbi:MAG TPA: DHH family phosphoesterase, partial [Kofleriaceae bacterium]|nr:DHH family phosphoesterase [Kofleriaceae bacterium]
MWRVRDADPQTVARLSSELGVRAVTARCLAARGINEAALAKSFLRPRLSELRPPVGLAGLPAAVDRIVAALAAGTRIGCFGDYDVDGVTTAALMSIYLRQLGATVVPRVACRAAGYGFSDSDVRAFHEAGCTLVITGDCGTSDIASIEQARQLGIDVIVVDHHTVPAGDVPHPAVALVNPFRSDSTFPFRGMASVGLTFYMMVALRTRLRDDGFFSRRAEPDLRALLDLVALGTVADLVPLNGENRILATHGMARLAARTRPGIDALMRIAGVDSGRPVDEKTIGWKLAPRLNAPGRLGDAAPALALLLAEDARTAAIWAERLEEANRERRIAQDRVVAEADAQLDGTEPGAAVVVAGRGWPPGVVGIVAARLVERYQRPVFVIAVDP